MCDSREKNTGLDALNEAFMELDRAYVQLARACGLSEAEFWCLVAVRHGAETQREICEQFSLSPQTVNSAFKLLIRKELIRLEPYAHNQRSKRAALTERGRAFVSERVAPLEALEAGMTPDAVLTDGEEALDALGELTGRTAKEEIVSRIFSRFCVGK